MVTTTAHYAPNTKLACGKDLVDCSFRSIFPTVWVTTSHGYQYLTSLCIVGTPLSCGGDDEQTSNFYPKDIFPTSVLAHVSLLNCSQEDINLCYYTDNVAVWLIDISILNICIVIMSIILCGGNLARQLLPA